MLTWQYHHVQAVGVVKWYGSVRRVIGDATWRMKLKKYHGS